MGLNISCWNRCRSGSNAVRGSEVTCCSVPQCIYMKCLQQTRLERVYLVQISIYCESKFASITHKLVTNLLSSFYFAWFFKKKCTHKCVDTVLYTSDMCSVPCLTAALHRLCWHATFSWHMLYSVVHYIYIVHVCTAVNY